ncbi:MAG: fasciclin domain-containing protein, partial [Bacteroidales bacterium]
MIKFKWYYVFMLFLPFLMVACDKNDDDEIIEYDDDIWDVVEQIPELSTLETAIQAAGLAPALDNDKATLTLFAPVNNAFAAMPAGELDKLLKDPTGALKDILLYHVVDGAYSPGM